MSPPARLIPWTLRRRLADGSEVAFTGKGPVDRVAAWASVGVDGVECAWARQVHSDRVLQARSAGLVGEGDALFTREPELALAVVTADCVPLLLGDGEQVAAVHAGWRGVAGGIVTRSLESFRDPSLIAAMIGPAIGPCCYEVGAEVAAQVVEASSEAVVDHRATRPHLDLSAAVRHQLEHGGVRSITAVNLCTRCEGEQLWSYRREGTAAGRNLAFIWRSDHGRG